MKMSSSNRMLIFMVTFNIFVLAYSGCNKVYAAFIESCKNDPGIENQYCNNTGDLKVRFCPALQTRILPDGTQMKSITCSTNKPANMSIILEGQEWPGMAKVFDNGCSKTIQFVGVSNCYRGTYKCTAKDSSGKTKVQTAQVNVHDSNFKVNFDVESENKDNPKKLILGSTMNLTCSLKGGDWKTANNVWFDFGYINSNGQFVKIGESKDIPKKFYWTDLEQKVDTVFVRKLQVARINETDSRVYACRVRSYVGYCYFTEILNVSARLCRAGHYCMANSSLEMPCPAGSYSNNTGVFGISSCTPCARGFYCATGSSQQTICPRAAYLPIDHKASFPLKPAGSLTDCRRCPLNVSCDSSYNCKFICASPQVFAYEEKTAELKCKIIKKSYLLRNLRWKKGNQLLTNSSNYHISVKGDYFRLVIKNVNMKHKGTYTCEGIETWMNGKVFDDVKLQVIGTDDVLSIVLTVVGVIVFCILVGFAAYCYIVKRKRLLQRLPSTSSRRKFLESVCTAGVTEDYGPEPSRRLQASPDSYDYDVFICYSSQDKEWVRKTLLKNLVDNKLKVCIDYKDFAPGAHIIQNIADAIYNSRKTIAVLSPDYVVSSWCNEELKMALGRIEDQHQVVPVMYRTCEVPNFLRQRTYLDYCNPDIRPIFWEQLIRAVTDGNSGYVQTSRDSVFEMEERVSVVTTQA